MNRGVEDERCKSDQQKNRRGVKPSIFWNWIIAPSDEVEDYLF
jgi:hypothetical protein